MVGSNQYLIQSLRLSRTLSLALLASVVLNLALTAPVAIDSWMMWATIVLSAVGAIILFAVIQGTLKLAKQLPEGDVDHAEKIGVLLSMGTMAMALMVHGLGGGYLNTLLLLALPLFSAQLMGLARLSRILAGVYVLTMLAGAWMGYPAIVTQHPGWLMARGNNLSGFWILVSLIPVFWTVGHYTLVLTKMARQATNRMEKLESLATTDGLTGLINRRQFNNRLFSEISRARRHHIPLTLALFDIDNFKKINDYYGHQTGDRILKELGKLIQDSIRESDVAARYGGEEFALILPETRLTEGHELMERIRQGVERHVFCLPDNPLPVTISIGVGQLDPEAHTAFELVELTDAALYEAKNQGKNRVVIANTYGTKVQMGLPTPKPSWKEPVKGGATPPQAQPQPQGVSERPQPVLPQRQPTSPIHEEGRHSSGRHPGPTGPEGPATPVGASPLQWTFSSTPPPTQS